MKYITGIYALNLICSLETDGDWHQSSLDWQNIEFAESKYSFFGDYGIEKNSSVPYHQGTYFVANHIRAILDLLYNNDFSTAQGMRKDFINTEKYDEEIFQMINRMNTLSNWQQINQFMEKEYKLKWIEHQRKGENYGKMAK